MGLNAFLSKALWILFWMFGVVGLLSAAPPNVVLIVVDDLGYADLSCTGLADDVDTPNLDHLAAEGVRFTQAYATAPICNASRIAMMTGRYQQRQETYWYSGPGLHRSDFPTIAETFKAAGYATAHIGKFHHSGRSDGPDGRGFPLNHGFDYLFGFSGGTKHYLRHKESYHFEGDMLHQGPMWVGDVQENVEGFTTDLFGEQARSWMRENKDDPFFLHLSFNAVHNYTHQLPDSYLQEKGIDPFPDWDRETENYWDWRGRLGYPAHPEGRNYYLGQLDLLDQEIGKVIAELESLSVRDRTVVAVVSDNGGSLVTYANNHPLKGGKYTLFEGGVRVPMIISYPDAVQSGQVSDQVASTMDLFPTLCQLSDLEPPQGLDGIDLTPAIAREDASNLTREPLFWDTGHEAAVREGNWKLLVTLKTPNKRLQITPTPAGTFLYNVENDPGENMDLSSRFPGIRERLETLLNTWQTSIRDN